MASSVPSSSSANEIQAQILASKYNRTALYGNAAPSWVDAPEFRGTTSILVSCLATLFACIYTALHLNVPIQRGTWRRLLNQMKWSAIAIVAPEIPMFSAMRQRSMAQAFVTELNRLHTTLTADDKQPDHPFDLRYGFFVLSGGLSVSVKDIVPTEAERAAISSDSLGATQRQLEPFLQPCLQPSETDRWRLSPEGVLELARCGHFIYISRETIDDKSKASIIQKVLVLAQVLWMVTQCVVRKVYDLPLTLLEVHTMVHVVGASVMYAMWLNKPLGVSVPEQAQQGSFNHLIALMVQEKAMRVRRHSKYCFLVLYGDTKVRPQVGMDGSGGIRLHEGQEPVPAVAFDPSQSRWLLPGQVLGCGIGIPTDSQKRVQITMKDEERLKLVMQAVRQLDPEPFPATQMYSCFRPRYRGREFWNAFIRQSNNWTDRRQASYEKQSKGEARTNPPRVLHAVFKKLTTPASSWWWLLFLALPVVYGGIHLTAWSSHFPTAVEGLIWKVSCFVVMGSLHLALLIVPVITVIIDVLYERFGIIGDEILIYSFFVVAASLAVAAVAARLYLVVESFIALRSAPIGVYWTPSWLQMIPHL